VISAPVTSLADARQARAVLASVRHGQRRLTPFDRPILDYLSDLSRRLRSWSLASRQPAVSALAFWIRRAEIERLRADWEVDAGGDGLISLPRGVAFHIPPTNVDTLFVYSWLLSALAGNANVVRLSPRALDAVESLMAQVRLTLDDHPVIDAATAFVTYEHDVEITAELSEADVRVIWGGDTAVSTIRSISCGPRTSELAFADRFSFALLDAEAVLHRLDVHELAVGLYNDAYWFDQLGCASPRAVLWRGQPDAVVDAEAILWAALAAQIDRRGGSAPAGAPMAKLVHLTESALSGDVERIRWSSGELATATLHDGADLRRDGPGGGLFYSRRIDDLREIPELVQRRDQTIAHAGFSRVELEELARSLGAAGVDRIVPIGSALQFDRFWDGHDLLRSFSRNVRVVA